MPYLGGGLVGLAVFALWLYCIFNVITTANSDCRNLPKTMWLIVVIFLPLIGSIMWLIAGRPQFATASATRAQQDPLAGKFPEYGRPGRHIASSPEDDEEFLRRCRERAEEQRRKAKEQQKRRVDREEG